MISQLYRYTYIYIFIYLFIIYYLFIYFVIYLFIYMHVGSQSLSPLRQHDPAGDSVFPKEEASIVFPSFFWYGTSFEVPAACPAHLRCCEGDSEAQGLLLTFELNGQDYAAKLVADRLEFNDGDVWLRAKKPAPRKRKAVEDGGWDHSRCRGMMHWGFPWGYPHGPHGWFLRDNSHHG